MTLPLLAGCTDTAFERAEGVDIRNADTVTHQATVVVLVDDDETVSQTVTVPADGRERIDQTLPGPGVIFGRRFETIVELEAGGTQSAEKTFRGANGFDEIEVFIDEDASIRITYEDGV